MSTRKSTVFYGFLIAFASIVVGMVLASRLDLAPRSLASMLSVPTTNSAPLNGPIDAGTFRNIAHDASPAVVSIVVKVSRPRETASLPDLFGFGTPFGNTQRRPTAPPAPETAVGAGSGFIIDKAGYILTNNHVVEDATSIEVHLASMRDGDYGLSAKVVGRDELSDAALIQLTEFPKEPLTEAKFGDSDQMAPGDWVMAIGNPFELSNTVTVGVVSAVGREQNGKYGGRPQSMIQTDAAINRGNSGGPLLNIRGEVVGINTMILSTGDEGGGNIGVGFAVPINTVRDLLPQLRQGKVTRGRIGVYLQGRPMTPDYAKDLGLPNTDGAEVNRLAPNGAAATAGMRIGDVIVEFNGKAVKSNTDLTSMVTRTAPGVTVPVKVIRDKKAVTLNVKIEELNLDAEQSQTASARPGSGSVAPKDTGFGMRIQNLTPAQLREYHVPAGRSGVLVTEVTPYGPAQQAGIDVGNIVMSVQGQPVRNVDEASKALDAVPTGRVARMTVWQASDQGEGDESLVQIRKR